MRSVIAGAVVAIAIACFSVPRMLLPNNPAKSDNKLLFDGVCNLCDGFVHIVMDNDSELRIRLGPQQKHKHLLDKYGIPSNLDTVVLIQDGNVYTHSTAVMRVMALLNGPVHLVSVLWLVPWPLRDFGYKMVARYRYLMFGRTDTCRPPDPKYTAHFLPEVRNTGDASVIVDAHDAKPGFMN